MKKFLCLFLFFTFFSNISVYAENVYYNTKTKKYHSLNCQYVKTCSANCIKLDKKDAIKLGGIPCKTCEKK